MANFSIILDKRRRLFCFFLDQWSLSMTEPGNKKRRNVVSECPLTFTENLRACPVRHSFSLLKFKRSWIEMTLISITSPESLLSVPGVAHLCTARAQYSFLANRTQLVWIIEGTCLAFFGSRWCQQLENSYRAKLISQLRSVNENCFSSMSVFLRSLIKTLNQNLNGKDSKRRILAPISRVKTPQDNFRLKLRKIRGALRQNNLRWL